VSFLETVSHAKAHLREHGRVSLRGLKREFALDDDAVDELVEELVDVQQVAGLEGKVLVWLSATGSPRPAAAPVTQAAPIATPETVAAPVADAGAAAAAERRQLTVMFCDLVGSTDLSQRLDAEDLRSVVRAYQEAASQAIDRYAGHIAQYLGDGLLVYFGYPQAHEDDAERAVRAGLEILTALRTLNGTLEPTYGIRLAARVGIHTGPVVIGEMGGGARSEVLALGDTTNIAARLETAAASDTVVISGATLRLAQGMFLTQDLGTPPLKGIAKPIRAYVVLRATGVRSRLDVDPRTLTPLIGRDQELGLLTERWEQAQERAGQAVLIAGEAGLGKSRLLQAFRERLTGTPHTWLECRCTPYTQGSAFHPLIELLEQGLGLKQDDDPETKLRRLEGGIERANLSVANVVPLIAALLLLPLPERYPPLRQSPELQRKQTMEALVTWTLTLAEQQPLVMLFEDLHWCDPSTVELLGLVLEQSPTAQVLTVLTFRPSFEAPWPARSHLTPLAVNRLSRRQATNMIASMTRGVPLPDAVVQRIVERADGVPLFVEEVTKMVLESDLVVARDGRYELTGPLTELAIPATLQDSLMARLDRLDAGKEVAQLGAALGREFHYELLRSVSLQEEPRLHAGLAQLVDAELLYQRGAPPEATYTFKHALIQDTAYQSLLKSVRQQFHTRIAQVLEERFPKRVASEPEVIARHYEQAGLATPAIAHYQRAGERATQRSANEEAIGLLQRSLGLVGTLPETRERNQQELGLRMAIGAPLAAARGWAYPEYERTYARARELASQIGESPELPRVLVGTAVAYYFKGDFATAAEVAQEALVAAERTGDAYDLLSAHYVVGATLFYPGNFSRALQHFEQSIQLYNPGEHASQVYTIGADMCVVSYELASQSHVYLGHPDQALAVSEEAMALAKRLQHPLSMVEALCNAAIVHSQRGEVDRTWKRTGEIVGLTEELGFPLYLEAGRFLRGWARVASGEGEAGIAEMQQAVIELARIGTGLGAPASLFLLAEGFWKVGRHEEALGALGLGVAQAEQQGQHYYDAELHRLRAEILLDKGGDAVEEAEALFGQSLEIARRQEAKSFELRTATSLARLWQRQGKRDAARALLAPLYAWFTEGFDTRDLIEAKTLLGELG
jgi:class 3 adenylate cyclase/predicted ATPase